MTKHNALPTTTDIEKAQSLDHHLLSTKQIKKTDQRGAHWKLKRNTLQAPKPGRWTFFWSKEETSIKLILQEYMRNHASILPFLQTFPWDLPECPDITIKHQRKAIWMHLYLYHLKGIIHIEFKPEFYCQILLETSMSGTLPFAFQPTITPKTYLNSFFGIYAFNVINLNAFNDNDLFPMPSGYFDTSKHFQITHERAYNRTFCRKAVVHTWHAMGFKETSPSRMEYDAFFSKRIKAQQQKEFAKRTASKALLALSKDPTKQPKLTNSPPSIKNKINIPYSPLILTDVLEDECEETVTLPYLSMMRNDVRKAKELVQLTLANLIQAQSTKSKDEDLKIDDLEQNFNDAITHLQTTLQNLKAIVSLY